MKLKINHFGSKGFNLSVLSGLEEFFTHLFLCFVAGVFAYLGYQGLVYLFVMSSIVCGLYFIAAVYNLYEFFLEKRRDKKAAESLSQ